MCKSNSEHVGSKMLLEGDKYPNTQVNKETIETPITRNRAKSRLYCRYTKQIAGDFLHVCILGYKYTWQQGT